ncbi:MAG: TonB-dependent receptor [Bacteroidetes bacterium]|nr:TonB-dependent receptor [Bacteroidota bacterium]
MFDNKNELSLGLKIQAIDTKLSLINAFSVKSNLEKFAANLSVYGKYKFLQWEDFGLDVGTRYNVSGLTSKGSGFFEPRINLSYSLSSMITIKAAWGIYLQELTTLSDENEIITLFRPWIIIPNYLSPSNAIHYVIGTFFRFTNTLDLSVEGYYKLMHNIPVVNDEKFTENDPELISVNGESYGWEFKLQYNDNPVNITTSYTISWAYRELNDYIYYPNYDSRNVFNILFEFNLGNGWITSAIWNYNSGLPFTEIVGYYDKAYFQDLDGIDQSGEDFQPFTLLGDRNIGRLPDYHRFDVSLSKRFQIYGFKILLGVDVINVYDRANIFYFDRDTGERVNMLPFMITGIIKVAI